MGYNLNFNKNSVRKIKIWLYFIIRQVSLNNRSKRRHWSTIKKSIYHSSTVDLTSGSVGGVWGSIKQTSHEVHLQSVSSAQFLFRFDQNWSGWHFLPRYWYPEFAFAFPGFSMICVLFQKYLHIASLRRRESPINIRWGSCCSSPLTTWHGLRETGLWQWDQQSWWRQW